MASLQDTAARSRPREQWADNLRVAVIAGVIVAHTATSYVVDIPWYYDDERTTSGVWPMLLSPPALLGALFALGPLFLVAGWFSARSLGHRGPGGFVRSRLLRLGRAAAGVCPAHQPAHRLPGPRPLLAFSVAYAALRCVRPAAQPRPLRPGLLAAAALAIAVSSFAVWQPWPVMGDTFLNLRWGEWPQGAVLFVLGVQAAEAGWLEDFPPVLARRLGWAAAAGVAALMTVMLYLVLARGKDQALAMGADVPTMAFALLDGVIAVTGTLWFLSWLRRRRPAHGRLLGQAARASYAT